MRFDNSTHPREITDARIKFISLVSKGANGKDFLIAKAQTSGDPELTLMNGPLLKLDQDEHTILGVVYEPGVHDADNEYMTEHEILKACRWFNEHGEGVDVHHDFAPVNGVQVLESYTLPGELQVGDKRVAKGAWLVKLGVRNDEIWTRVKNGELNAYSMGGRGTFIAKTAGENEAESGLKAVFRWIGEKLGMLQRDTGAPESPKTSPETGGDASQKQTREPTKTEQKGERQTMTNEEFNAVVDKLRSAIVTDTKPAAKEETKPAPATDKAVMKSVFAEVLQESGLIQKAGEPAPEANPTKPTNPTNPTEPTNQSEPAPGGTQATGEGETLLTKADAQFISEIVDAKIQPIAEMIQKAYGAPKGTTNLNDAPPAPPGQDAGRLQKNANAPFSLPKGIL